MTDYVFLVLFVMHVGSIVGWMGAALLFVSVLGPSISSLTPAARSEFLLKVVPRYTRYILTTAILSVIFGLLLYGYALRQNYLPSGNGLTLLQSGAGVGLIAFLIAVLFVIPTAGNLVKTQRDSSVQTSGNQSGAMVALSRRVMMGTGIVTVLLLLALFLMVFGTNI